MRREGEGHTDTIKDSNVVSESELYCQGLFAHTRKTTNGFHFYFHLILKRDYRYCSVEGVNIPLHLGVAAQHTLSQVEKTEEGTEKENKTV